MSIFNIMLFSGVVFVLGVLIVELLFVISKVGILRIEQTDLNDFNLFLELEKNIDEVRTKRYVVLKINDESFFSRK